MIFRRQQITRPRIMPKRTEGTADNTGELAGYENAKLHHFTKSGGSIGASGLILTASQIRAFDGSAHTIAGNSHPRAAAIRNPESQSLDRRNFSFCTFPAIPKLPFLPQAFGGVCVRNLDV
jgi:hypothetical protein